MQHLKPLDLIPVWYAMLDLPHPVLIQLTFGA